ncbi:MAG: hypothetical protein LBS21_09430 [Clostridiales bacterium]|jgi:hypothetical protein|nr:hypothetical protein [Clostridiales bacterium]
MEKTKNIIDNITTESMQEIKRYIDQALNQLRVTLKEEICGDLYKGSAKRRI